MTESDASGPSDDCATRTSLMPRLGDGWVTHAHPATAQGRFADALYKTLDEIIEGLENP